MIVIADDITGAAEIAGIAFGKGQAVRLVCYDNHVCCRSMATEGTCVIATDTRSMTEAEAIATTRRISSHLFPSDPYPSRLGPSLFKKTDSALRGHVMAELTAFMAATVCQRAVYMPANPSKGRTIRHGIYHIHNIPIHETDFSFDPEFPARTSVLRERFPDAEAKGIIMPDAETIDDIRRIVATYDDGKTLFAGAADLFEAYLHRHTPGVRAKRTMSPPKADWQSGQGGLYKSPLILSGSTQSRPLALDIPTAPMPREIYDGSTDLSLWDTRSTDVTHGLILTIPYTHRTGKEAAVHLRTMMARKAKELIVEHHPSPEAATGKGLHIIIEGGATAWATLQELGWTQFDIVGQVASGVVQMQSVTSGTLVTLKPGSYPWGSLFDSLLH